MSALKRWQFWLGLAISLLFLYFALRGLGLKDLGVALRGANYAWLLPGIAVYFIAVWVRAWRWHYLVRPVKSVPTRRMFPIVAIGYMGNNIYPARAGEVFRALFLKSREGVPISTSLATIIVERIFDGVVMLAFVFLNLPELARLTADSGFVGSIQTIALWGTAAFFGALLVFLLAAMYPEKTYDLVSRVVNRLLPERFRQTTMSLVDKFLGGLGALRSPKDALMIFLTSVIIWLLETWKYWFVMHAFPFQVSFFALMLMNGIVNLATTIPSAPGYVGTFDAPGIAVLTAYGVDKAVAVAYTLVLHIALWVPITALGAYYFLREGVKWKPGIEKLEVEELKKISILGAGIGGMAAAYDLVRSGHQVVIYEASDGVGGLASGFKEPHWEWSVEKYYHHWFQSDRHILELIEELGWSEKVLFPRPYTVLYYRDKFYPFDSILSALLFPGLGWGINKLRFGLVGLYLRLTGNWRSLESTTVDVWMRKWAGDRVYELMWEPLMVGKFGERYARQVNMSWMWARLKARTTHLGTFEGGFQAFADDFAQRLIEMGVRLNLSDPVEKINSLPSGALVISARSGQAQFDQCLATTAPALLARLAPDLPAEYLEGLLDLKSMGAVVMVLALNQRLSEQGYYWFNLPKSAGFPFLALVEHTNFVSEQHFGGDHIVYAGDYLEPDHEFFKLSKDELLQRFLPAFSRINPAFDPEWVRDSWLFRTAYAQPVPLVSHSRNIPAIQTPLPNLYFASMSQVYPWDRGTDFAVEIGRRAARLMLDGIGEG